MLRTIALALLFLSATNAFAGDPLIGLKPCHVRNVKQRLLCGTFEVYEDRDRQQGRKIPLNIVVLPATGKSKMADPLFYFSGGPGEGATNEIELTFQTWSEINVNRDIVLVDVRGTGHSNPLSCVADDRVAAVQSMLDSFWSSRDLSVCRTKLESRANLKLYNTRLAVDDLDDVRAGLGYDRINIIGASYGSRVVQAYLRQHGDHVRTATMWDVFPVFAKMPLTFAADAQKSLDGVIAVCQKDAECHSAFSITTQELAQVLLHAEQQPIKAEAEDRSANRKVQLSLSRNGIAQTIRYMLYSPKTAVQVPLQIHLAAQGNYGPLAQSAYDFLSGTQDSIAEGYFLSTTCTEDVPFYTPEEGNEASRNTFLGTFRVKAQKNGCEQWSAQPDPSFVEPVHSDVPTLLIGGDLDPVNPPAFVRAVAKNLTHSRVLLVQGGAHDFEGMTNSHCIDLVINDFLNTGDENKIDMKCVETMTPPKFVLHQ